MFIVHTLDEIQGLIDAHGQFKATLGEADKEFQAIMSLIKDVENFAKQFNVPGATINPYTNLTGNVRAKIILLFKWMIFLCIVFCLHLCNFLVKGCSEVAWSRFWAASRQGASSRNLVLTFWLITVFIKSRLK